MALKELARAESVNAASGVWRIVFWIHPLVGSVSV